MADPVAIKANLRSAFRDYQVDGVPGSGANEPVKSEVRSALASTIDYVSEVASSAAAGRRAFATLVARDAWADRPIGAIASVQETGLDYRWDGTTWAVWTDPLVSAADRAESAEAGSVSAKDDALAAVAQVQDAAESADQARDDAVAAAAAVAGEQVVPDEWAKTEGVSDDEEADVVFGVTTRGVFKAQMFDKIPDDTFGNALIDRTTGARMAEWGPDGLSRFGVQPRLTWKAWGQADGDGVSQVWIGAPGRASIQITAGDEPCVGPTVDGLVVNWLRLSTPARLETFSLAPSIAATPGTTTLNHVAGLGQSLIYGERSTPLLTTSAVLPGRVLMLNGGLRTLGTSHGPSDLPNIIPDACAMSIVDAVERNDNSSGESPGSQLGREFITRRPSDEAVVVTLHGIGSTAYSELKKGTQRWRNLVATIARVRAMALVAGLTYRFVGMHWDQGEAQVTETASAYAAHLIELQTDLTSAVQELIGGTDEAPVFLHQLSSFTKLGYATSAVPQGQLNAHLAEPEKIVLVGPKYQMASATDGVHLTNASSALSGALIGRAMADHLDGDPVGPLHIVSAVRAGTTVTVTFAGMDGALTRSTSLVTDPGSSGLEWLDDAGDVSITPGSESVTGPAALTFTLTGVPTGANPRLVLAGRGTIGANSGPTTGARAPFRDSSADVNAHGAAMHRYAVHQTIPVTI